VPTRCYGTPSRQPPRLWVDENYEFIYYQPTSRVMLRGAASAMYINPQMITCGGEFGLNGCF
jgi:hypothetical protein